MKFIHIADIHASRERLSQTLHILKTLTERAKQGDIDFIIFAGDFWDSTITATKGSGFSDIIAAIRNLEKETTLFFIYGTPSHEPLGSLDAFRNKNCYVIDNPMFVPDAMENILFIPEPRRSDFVKESIDETNKAINKMLEHTVKESLKDKKTYGENKPLIVVYHGEVKGATYQNGVSASSPTAIPKELLQSLNADYYALGHIHMPQEVFPNAWYSGSACPKNFGETHDGCYNLVTIENGKTKVERISFELPMYLTLYKDPRTVTSGSMDRTNLRFVFDCTKEERKTLNIKQLADEVKMKTGALSVKLEPNVVESESASRSEVSKRKSIVDKMVEYAKEKGIKIPKHAKEILQDIQDNTLIKLVYPQHSFELLSLSLRGAIGIRNGQHKEDFELDFEKFEDGVVCLCADNGRGKTTCVENCHPYPCMLTRDGTLKEHFYLKDSHRILIYKDENGLYYKISMLIDGKTATGKTSYFVETSKDRKAWTSLPEVDGSLKSYEDWVNGTFGSIDVLLRTAFFAKEQTKNATDISATTKSERMELLSKLAGTEHLKEVSEIARTQRKAVKSDAEMLEVEIESYSRYNDIIKQNEQDIASDEKELEEQKDIISVLENEISELKIKDAEFQKVKAVSEMNAKLREQYQKELDDKEDIYKLLEEALDNSIVYDKIDSSKSVIATNAPLIEKYLSDVKSTEKELAEVSERVAELNKVITDKRLDLSKVQSHITLLNSQSVDISDTCPTCGAKLSEHKKSELSRHVDKIKSELASYTSDEKLISKALEENETELKKIDRTKELKDKLAALQSDLADLQSESQSCSDFISNLDEIYLKYSYDDIVEEHRQLTDEISSLHKKIETLTDNNSICDVSEELSEKELSLKEASDRKSELTATIKAAKKENERYEKELETVADKRRELKELNDKINAYLFIEDAFSNNGIPAIELRDSAPEIADIANKILKDSYGNRFEIRFGSTSELKANRKANEDFNILVYDNENNDEKTIDLVSSGERIWLKQALFYAFSIVQMNRTGFNFRTRLIDESDGSLDGGLRPKYLQMVESAHKYSDSRITILITHSQEIKDIAQQVIEI